MVPAAPRRARWWSSLLLPTDRTPTWLALVPIAALTIGLVVTRDQVCPSNVYGPWALCATSPWPPLLVGLGFGSALGMFVDRFTGAALAVAFAVVWLLEAEGPPLWTVLAVGHALSCVAFIFWYRWREARGARTDRDPTYWPQLTRIERLVIAVPLLGAAVTLTITLLPRSWAGAWWDWLFPATLAGALAVCYAAASFTSPRVFETRMFGDQPASDSTVADLGPPVTVDELAGEDGAGEYGSHRDRLIWALGLNFAAAPTFMLLSVLHRPGWVAALACAVALVTVVMVQWPLEWSWTAIRWNAGGFAARHGYATVAVRWREVHGIERMSGHVNIHTTRGTVPVLVKGSSVEDRRHSGQVLSALLRRDAQRALSDPDSADVPLPAPPRRRSVRWYGFWLAAVVVLGGLLAVVP